MTPQDLKQIESLLKDQDERLEKKIHSAKKELLDAIEDSRAEIIAAVDEHKADKEEVNALSKRVGKLEQTVFS